MGPSIAMACNVYQDAPALRGLLETSARFFDNLFIVHAGPGGAYSTDGTIELCEQFGATIVFDDIERGFGAIRTRLVHDCGCAWAMILDADERFHPILPAYRCVGEANLAVTVQPGEIINQGNHLRRLIAMTEIEHKDYVAIRSIRRHWHDFGMTKPSQNWMHTRDWQLRIVKNIPEVIYRSEVRMHEQIHDIRTNTTPRFHQEDDYHGPFHDHYHLFFRRTQPGHKEFNEENYQRLTRGERMLVKEK